MQSDPRIISVRVEELSACVEDWERRSAAAIEAADEALRHAAELVERAQSTATMVLDEAQVDLAAAERLAAESAQMRSRCEETFRAATTASQAASATQSTAQAAVARWESELAQAQSWLQRAIQAEEQARAALQQAESALATAHAALGSAQSALAAAQSRTEYVGNDSKGQAIYRPVDTSPYIAAVHQAQHQLNFCQQAVQAARAALSAAQADRRSAQARVDRCTHAVGLAQQGAHCAAQALQSAYGAIASAERAVETQQSADRIAAQVRSDAQEELQAAESAAAEVGQARDAHGAAAQQKQVAHDLTESARQRSCQYRFEVTWRLERLRAFDHPIHEF